MQKASYTLGTDGKAEQAARFQSLQSEDMRLGLAGVDYAQLAGLSEDVRRPMLRLNPGGMFISPVVGTLKGPFSAGSKPILASKASFCSKIDMLQHRSKLKVRSFFSHPPYPHLLFES